MTATERRADALVGLCRYYLDHQGRIVGRRNRPHVNVIVDADHLHDGDGAHYLDGTPIDPAALQAMLCDSSLHRALIKGRSSILDYGTAAGTVPANLFNALVLRDSGCRFEGCDRPASWCDGHHVTPSSMAARPSSETWCWSASGTTI